MGIAHSRIKGERRSGPVVARAGAAKPIDTSAQTTNEPEIRPVL